MDWNELWTIVKDFFVNSGLKVLEAIGILILGIIVIKLLLFVLRKIFSKTKMEGITQKFVVNIIKYGLDLILIFIILQVVGIPITGLVAVLSTAGLAIVLALKDSLSNLANGIILMSVKSFKEGDYLSVNGVEGKVEAINLMTTKIITTDNKLVTIPNSQILNSPVINYNGQSSRRVDFTFSVAYESDIEKAKKIIIDVMLSNGNVKTDPAPFVSLKTLGSSSVDIFANCWVDAEDYWTVYYYIMDNVFNEFKRNNISIPYDQCEVRIRKDEVKMPYKAKKLPERIEKVKIKDNDESILGFIKINKKSKEKKLAKLEKQKQKLLAKNNDNSSGV